MSIVGSVEGGVLKELLKVISVNVLGADKMAQTPNTRLVILGITGVGKSALVVRFISKRFIWEYDPTLECIYKHSICLDDENITMEILDTAGSTDNLHQEGNICWGDGFIFVYSINDRDSFDQIQHLYKLVCSLKKMNEVPCVIVGNKNDLDHDRQVSIEEGEQLALKLSCIFYECSACEGGDVVNEIFIELHHSILRRRLVQPPRRRSSAHQVIHVLNKMFTKINS
ncbi:ras-related and estrogen-regulated growth inhibitor-like isoform X1 [Centruroides vittatus]|uniref:ras-related and estrogen-regulated growth inhibitor-like isoform X1 n=1 Tax=Centruroides vittatus TaxID=120091 RepID=UPI00350FE51F